MNDAAKEKRDRLRFWGLVFLLGPMPICPLIALDIFRILPSELSQPIPICAFFGGLWGLASGVRSRQLSRAIVGLNCGALFGFGAGYLLSSGRIVFETAALTCAISLGAVTGLLRIEASDPLRSFRSGFLNGVVAMTVMAVTFYVLATLLSPLVSQMFAVFVGGVASALGIAVLLMRRSQPPGQTG